jgi:hypothetical protein
MPRPKVNVDILEIIGLRWAGHSWREISSQTGLGYGTARRAYLAAISLLQVSQNPKAGTAVKRAPRTNGFKAESKMVFAIRDANPRKEFIETIARSQASPVG